MKTWVRKTLSVGVLAAGALLLAPGAAHADSWQSSGDNTGLLNGTQVVAPVTAPVNVAGNALGILGLADAQGVGVNRVESGSCGNVIGLIGVGFGSGSCGNHIGGGLLGDRWGAGRGHRPFGHGHRPFGHRHFDGVRGIVWDDSAVCDDDDYLTAGQGDFYLGDDGQGDFALGNGHKPKPVKSNGYGTKGGHKGGTKGHGAKPATNDGYGTKGNGAKPATNDDGYGTKGNGAKPVTNHGSKPATSKPSSSKPATSKPATNHGAKPATNDGYGDVSPAGSVSDSKGGRKTVTEATAS